ncbi:hypothetical protein DPMN_188065 [Dreissena polymorpha]|uniref:Uncharacterized protein n=1 Tax=Dreissena polymorpha TaxID=45954 RepID=A0A9D4CRS2_DREPO|nr:hypothetical protein DPMN_055028 [Dreissena polymorpha]KAH3753429.1 hypothetical protein DPMN_188065 [Dreissena polymorpha]
MTHAKWPYLGSALVDSDLDPSSNKAYVAGDINSTNLLVILGYGSKKETFTCEQPCPIRGKENFKEISRKPNESWEKNSE